MKSVFLRSQNPRGHVASVVPVHFFKEKLNKASVDNIHHMSQTVLQELQKYGTIFQQQRSLLVHYLVCR